MRSVFKSAGMLCLALSCLLLNAGCQKNFHSSYFGVEDRALLTPKEFGQTQQVVEKAKEGADSVYSQRKINDAMNYGHQAGIVYWACHDQLAKDLLALARQAAYEAELFHPQPPPPAPKRIASLISAPEPPDSLDPGPAFAGLKALPPPMILGTVNFAFDIYKIDTEAKSILNKNAPILNDISNYHLEIAGHEIAGHTDYVGSDAYNQLLSENRATTVLYYLASKGVPPYKMFPVGYGENELLDPTPTEAAQTKNRRAEIRITGSLIPDFPVKNLSSLPVGTTIEIISFNYGSYKLLPTDELVLDKDINSIKESPNSYFEIAGYADSTELGRLNKDLALRRANSIRDYLVSKGIGPSRFKTSVYEDKRPLVSPEGSIGRKLNRRVEIKILP